MTNIQGSFAMRNKRLSTKWKKLSWQVTSLGFQPIVRQQFNFRSQTRKRKNNNIQVTRILSRLKNIRLKPLVLSGEGYQVKWIPWRRDDLCLYITAFQCTQRFLSKSIWISNQAFEGVYFLFWTFKVSKEKKLHLNFNSKFQDVLLSSIKFHQVST